MGLRSAFVASDSLTGAAGDAMSALVLAHDFHPGAITLAAAHLVPQVGAFGVWLQGGGLVMMVHARSQLLPSR